jgi:hypothetical protein
MMVSAALAFFASAALPITWQYLPFWLSLVPGYIFKSLPCIYLWYRCYLFHRVINNSSLRLFTFTKTPLLLFVSAIAVAVGVSVLLLGSDAFSGHTFSNLDIFNAELVCGSLGRAMTVLFYRMHMHISVVVVKNLMGKRDREPHGTKNIRESHKQREAGNLMKQKRQENLMGQREREAGNLIGQKALTFVVCRSGSPTGGVLTSISPSPTPTSTSLCCSATYSLS